MKVHGLGWLERREPLLSRNVQVAAAGPEVVNCLLDGVLERPPGVADAQADFEETCSLADELTAERVQETCEKVQERTEAEERKAEAKAEEAAKKAQEKAEAAEKKKRRSWPVGRSSF